MSTKRASRRSVVADRLHSAAIHLLRTVRVCDEATGLSPARLSALSVLVFGGERTVSELARAEQVAGPTMTRLVQGLEADGYVLRRSDRRDGRVVRVRASARGRRLLEKARRARVDALVEALAPLPDEALAALERAADALQEVFMSRRAEDP